MAKLKGFGWRLAAWIGGTTDRRFKRVLLRRLLVAGLLSSLLSLAVTSAIEFKQLADQVAQLAADEVDLMVHPEDGAMVSPGELAEGLVKEHFLSAELYGTDHTVLAHAVRQTSLPKDKLARLLADEHVPLPKGGRPRFTLHLVDGNLFVKIITPALPVGDNQIGYLEGLYQVDRHTLHVTLGEILMTLGEVLFGVLATTAVLYPAVLSVSAELVRRNAELAEVNAAYAAKSDFIANMAHELRSPLNAVIGFAEVMRLELLGPLGSDRYREYSEDIHLSGTHLLSLINDLLDLSKIEAGKLTLHEEVMEMAAVLETCERLTAMRFRQKGVQLTVRKTAGLRLRGDTRKVVQILLNLMTNAFKFTPQHGRVTVAADLRGGKVVLMVADTGIGIAPHDIPLVLSPYGQTGASTQEGTGLGLPLAKRLAELHGGSLEIDSAPGAGTTVTVTFPAERALQPVTAAKPPPPLTAVEGPGATGALPGRS